MRKVFHKEHEHRNKKTGSQTHREAIVRTPLFKGRIDLTKNTKKGGGEEKLLKGRGVLRRGGFCRKGEGMLLVSVFFF